jgi:hypothetical protein
MYSLKFSVSVSFSGEHPDLSEYWPCETTLADVLRAWPGEGLTPSDPFDSDYDYMAREGSLPKRVLDVLENSPTETRFRICRKLKEHFPREAFWACISDVQGGGIFDRETLFGFLDSIGAHFETENTMGTLGGPLGGCVPDFAFNVESQALISCIRVTPFLAKDGEPCRSPSESQWAELARVFRTYGVWQLARGHASGK